MVFSQLISELSVESCIDLIRSADMPDIRDVSFIDGRETVFENDVVYFGREEQLAEGGMAPQQCIVSAYTGRLDLREVRCLAAVPDACLFAAFNSARRVVDASTGRGLYEELIRIADKTQNIDAVLNAAAVKLGNSLIFSDTEYRIISSSTSIPVDDPIWKSNIEQGYCSYEFVTGATKLESVQNAPYTTDAIEVTCYLSPYRKLSSKVLHGGIQIGFVLMIASETPVLLAHFSMLKSVSQALTYTISNYATYLFQGIDRYQQLLYSLLIGAATEDLAPKLSTLTFPAYMIAICVRQTRYLGQKHMKVSVREELYRIFPGAHAAYYKGCIAAVLPLGDKIELSLDELRQLSDFSDNQLVKVGVSHSFALIENFASHYDQATTALDLAQKFGQPGNVAQFKDYQIFDLFSQANDTVKLGLYCHPLLGLLRQYDHKNGTELYNTLRYYVNTGGNIKNTAELLFIHRNSLVYRLERIKGIGKIDINEPDTQFLLKLSFEIDQYLGLDM